LHCSGRVNAEEVQALAHVLMTGPARGAGTAPTQWHHCHEVAGIPFGYVWAYGGYTAGHFVTEDCWDTHTCVHRAVPDVQVGTADAGEGDRDLYLSGTGNR
jgi:hypothetical protein